tara:strand:+ start:3278 stop:3529 length:252 start_codon:yes stop_codon:yes gene_type:complete
MIFGIIFLPIIIFLPGFLLTRILLGEKDNIELFLLSIGMSLAILVLLGLLLSAVGGITSLGLWLSYGLMLLVLFSIFLKKTKK